MTIDLKFSRTTKVAAALAGLLLALPRGAGAQSCSAENAFATGVFFEVAESINCNPGGSADPLTDPFCTNEVSKGFGTRIADATLTGQITSESPFSGNATIEASSILNQKDWTGPAHGKIALENGVRATFSGQLNLALLQMGQAPIAPISGRWHGTKGTLQAGGAFTGTFFVPVPCPESSGITGACYIRLDDQGNVIGIEPAFAPTGIPLVKLEVVFCN